MNGPVVFLTFFNFDLNFVIWSSWSEQVSSWSCFDWLYRASPSLNAKNIINQFSVDQNQKSKSSILLLEQGVGYDQCIVLAELLDFACFILSSKDKLPCLSRYFLTSYFNIPVSYDKKDVCVCVCVCVLVLEGPESLHRTIKLQLLWH